MSRRHCQPPHRDSSHEQFLREVVDVFVADESRKPAYLAFAREVARAERRAQQLELQAASHKLRAKAGIVPRSANVELGAVQPRFSAPIP